MLSFLTQNNLLWKPTVFLGSETVQYHLFFEKQLFYIAVIWEKNCMPETCNYLGNENVTLKLNIKK